MRTTPKAHYVRHNAVTRVPRNYIYLGTEAHRADDHGRELQTFRLAVAAYDTNYSHKPGRRPREWHRSTCPADLWEWVTGRCKAKARTVLVAHNLAYDLRIADAFRELPRLGWRFKMGRLESRQVWVVWVKGNRTLSMVDAMSWVPVGLERLGEFVEMPKLALPDWEDDDDAWFKRCTRDVEILGEVWGRLIAWIVDEDLGNWKPSGAGQSWAAFRHRFMPHRLLVHEDDDARRAERAACHTGRCEAWRHGRLIDGPYTEWDFRSAYATIGAECDVPSQLMGEMSNPTLEKVLHAAGSRSVLCEVEVETDEPILPMRLASGIAWPVGVVRTTVWEHELALVVGAAQRVDVGRAWVYRRAPALRAFCRWVLDGMAGRRGDLDPVVVVALKHWSRALIGRTAAQWPTWNRWGTAPGHDVRLGKVYDRSSGERFELLQLGDELHRSSERRENPDAMVAVMSWVMAEARVRLWNAMQVAGLDNVVYVDTDSLITGPAGTARVCSAGVAGLRVKDVHESLEVLGPRQLISAGRLKASGVPRGSLRVSEREWRGEVWSGLETALRTGDVDSVEVALRTFELRGTDHRRLHLDCGGTAAISV